MDKKKVPLAGKPGEIMSRLEGRRPLKSMVVNFDSRQAVMDAINEVAALSYKEGWLDCREYQKQGRDTTEPPAKNMEIKLKD